MKLDVEKIRQDFPVLNQKINGYPLAYFDNAATTLKPQSVIDALNSYYLKDTANIHRGVHTLSERATEKYEETRTAIQKFLNASSSQEIIFTKGTTESINLVANSFVPTFLQPGDEIIISHMEHHSNIVPWQMITEQTGTQLKVIPINHQGEIILSELKKLLTPRTKLLSVVAISNSLGTINPIKEIIKMAHQQGAKVLIDAAQAVAHMPFDVAEFDIDFLAFSGHKIYGPTGVGVLYGKKELLNKMRPYQGGGDMIESVTFLKTTYNQLPYKFEAGTPPIAEVIALKESLNYLLKLGWKEIEEYEIYLRDYAKEKLLQVPGLKLIGDAQQKSAIHSFVLEKVHPHDIGTFMDQFGLALRTGHHCTQPVMEFFKVPATARASFSFYNTPEEIDRLQKALLHTVEFFS